MPGKQRDFAASAPEGYEFIKEVGGIREYRMLSNGLTVLLRRDDSAPVVTLMITYLVGSRNEATGYTGATHLLEHMMFKGTPTFNREKGTQIAAELQKVGALMNATTWFDRTNYYEVLPAEQLEFAIKIEADRMRNSMLREEDHRSEMTVVRNEFDIGENKPERVLHDRLFAHAYIAHPYHHSTIGWRSDIENVSTKRLKEFYDTYYWPNNATVSIIGHFPEPGVFDMLKEHFGAISASPHEIPPMYTSEPEQQGEVRFTLRRAGQVGMVAIGHKIPEALHEDTAALEVLSGVLSMGKSSRLYRKLIDTNLAMVQYTHAFQLRDPSLIITHATLTPESTQTEIEKIILDTYEQVAQEGISERELEIVRNLIMADLAYDRDGTYAYASRLNEAIGSANWEFYVTYLDRIKAVRREDVQRVAATYLIADKRTIGWFDPVQSEEQDGVSSSSGASAPVGYFGGGLPVSPGVPAAPAFPGTASVRLPQASFADRVQEVGLESGARCLVMRTGVEEVVSIRGVLKAGNYFSPRNRPMVARLTTEMLEYGTRRHDKFQLAELLDEVGAELSFSSGIFNVRTRGRFLKKDMARVFDLLAEMLRMPAFDEQEFEKVKQQEIAYWQKRLDSTAERVDNMLSRAIFPEHHPYWEPDLSTFVDLVKEVTIEDVRRFYQQSFGGRSLLLSVVGDVDVEPVAELFRSHFADWQNGLEPPKIERLGVSEPQTLRFAMPDKPNIDLYFGHTGIPRLGDEDYLPFVIGNHILGDSPLSSRLGVEIRDTRGLTYSIYSFISTASDIDGMWGIYMAVSPPQLDESLQAIRDLLEEFLQKGVSEQEVNDEKLTMVGKFKVTSGLNTGALASRLIYVEDEKLGLEFLDRYAERVEAVTVDQVNAALRKYIHPEKMSVAMAGGLPS